MRYGMDFGFIVENGELFGINLGADYVAEHECGIKGLLEHFECDNKLKGLYSRKINKGQIFNLLYEGWYVLTSQDKLLEKGIPDYVMAWPTQKVDYNGEEVEIKCGWDNNDFAFLVNNQSIFNVLYEAFINKNIALSVGGSKNPFQNPGLNILIFDKLPKKFLKESVRKQVSFETNELKLHTSKEYKALLAKKKEWKEKYPFARSTPWDFMFLGKFDGNKFWLNPNNQQHINFGWFTLSDLQDWADEKPGEIIESKEVFEDLKLELSIPLNTWAFNPRHDSSYRKNFKGISLNHRRGREDKLPPLGKKERYSSIYSLDGKTIEYIESAVKYALVDDMFCQMGIYSFGSYSEENRKEAYLEFISKLKSPISIREEADREVWGMFHMLHVLGYGDYSACNIPEGNGIQNLSYWKNRLEYEAQYDFLNLCGMLPEAWKIDFNKEQKNE